MNKYIFPGADASLPLSDVVKGMEKAGFEREGVLRATMFRAGKWRDNIVYALLRD